MQEIANDVIKIFDSILNDDRISKEVRDDIADQIERVVLKYVKA